MTCTILNKTFASDCHCYYAAQRGEIKMFVQKKNAHLSFVIDIFIIKVKRQRERMWNSRMIVSAPYIYPATLFPLKSRFPSGISYETRLTISHLEESKRREEGRNEIEGLIPASHQLAENRKLKLRHTIPYAN